MWRERLLVALRYCPQLPYVAHGSSDQIAATTFLSHCKVAADMRIVAPFVIRIAQGFYMQYRGRRIFLATSLVQRNCSFALSNQERRPNCTSLHSLLAANQFFGSSALEGIQGKRNLHLMIFSANTLPGSWLLLVPGLMWYLSRAT